MELKPLNPIATETPVSRYIGMLIDSVGVIHAMHLITKSWARHRALDGYYKEMPELIDSFAEAYIARHEVYLSPIPTPHASAEDLLNRLCELGCAIHDDLSPDLSNPLEDILTKISSTLYKLRFN